MVDFYGVFSLYAATLMTATVIFFLEMILKGTKNTTTITGAGRKGASLSSNSKSRYHRGGGRSNIRSDATPHPPFRLTY
ncbi:hypothetical protein O3P69_018452 [Scylla paramamosain]|uniref:Uncharacterized protein n=1 Tax=Scylla paramamosain TaxID=85552 RepID=A0AAW0T2A7_SCYPA